MSGEGFLSRWSRRKRGVEPEAAPEPPAHGGAAPMPAALPAALPDPAAAVADAFDPASLPPLESLGPESDFTAFLRPNVPALLRQAALRRMWSLDPGIRDFVGPADYAWDFNAPDGVPGFSLELGGDLRKLLAQAIGAPPEPEEDEATTLEAAAPGAVPEGAAAGAPEASPAGEAPVAEGGAPDAPLPAPAAHAPAPPSPLRLSLPHGALPLLDGPPLDAPPLDAPVVAAPAGAAAPGPLPLRRRHGGAVPQ